MWKILTNQRGQSPFWGGFLQGLSKSLQASKEREFRKQSLKLQQQQIKIQEQNAQLQQDMLKHKLEQAAQESQGRQNLQDFLNAPTPEQPPQQSYAVPEPAQQSAFREQVLGPAKQPFNIGMTPPSQANQLLAARIGAGEKISPQMFGGATAQNRPSVVGAGGALVSPTGEVLFQNPSAPHMGVGAASRIFEGLVQKHGGDINAAKDEYITVLENMAAARGAGAVKGKTRVKATPGYQQTEQDVARVRRAGVGQGAAITKRRELDNVRAIVDGLDKLTQNLNVETDWAKANITGGANFLAGKAGKNPVAKSYMDQRSAFTGVLSRSLGGEKGVLTDRDIERVTKALPDFRDTKQVRDYKIGIIRNLIDVAVEAQIAITENREPDPTVRGKIDQLINSLSSAGGENPSATSKNDRLKGLGF